MPISLNMVGSRYIVLTSHNTHAMLIADALLSISSGYVLQEESGVTISCKLRLILAQVNVERAKQGSPPLSLRRLAGESGVSLSVLAALHTGRSQRIDYATIDQLLTYFNSYFSVTTSDLLVWEHSGGDTVTLPGQKYRASG